MNYAKKSDWAQAKADDLMRRALYVPSRRDGKVRTRYPAPTVQAGIYDEAIRFRGIAASLRARGL